jgi:hypothetical protein
LPYQKWERFVSNIVLSGRLEVVGPTLAAIRGLASGRHPPSSRNDAPASGAILVFGAIGLGRKINAVKAAEFISQQFGMQISVTY